MSDSPKKVTKKAAPKKVAAHPKYTVMITEAIASLKERTGSSRQAILKYIQANFKVGESAPVHLKTSLRRMLAANQLIQVKGAGASGSFRLAAQPKPAKKKVVKKAPAKKPAAAAKKPKKKAAATSSSAKKATPKKKVAKKPATKRTPAKKGAKKPVAKKPASKKTKATPKKKTAAKKSKK